MQWYIFNVNIFFTELCHQSDTELLTTKGTLLLVYEMYHQKKKVRNCKNFVSLNPTVAYQMQLGLALADSLLERIAKVIQKC